jgi:acyl-CoA synthetase (AMP-forming)/AMP-acid ligase II
MNQLMKMTPTGALMHQTQTRPTSVAFVFHEEVWTYERLAAEADRLARGLAARGVEPGDRIALHMMNRPEMVVAYYACFKLGAIAAPLRTAFKFAELAPLLQRLKPALYIGEMSLYGNVAPVDASILAPDKALSSTEPSKTTASSDGKRYSTWPLTRIFRSRPLRINPQC